MLPNLPRRSSTQFVPLYTVLAVNEDAVVGNVLCEIYYSELCPSYPWSSPPPNVPAGDARARYHTTAELVWLFVTSCRGPIRCGLFGHAVFPLQETSLTSSANGGTCGWPRTESLDLDLSPVCASMNAPVPSAGPFLTNQCIHEGCHVYLLDEILFPGTAEDDAWRCARTSPILGSPGPHTQPPPPWEPRFAHSFHAQTISWGAPESGSGFPHSLRLHLD